MATSKEFHDYILENLKLAGNVVTRPMMGEYLVYYNGRLVGNICDNCFLLKQTKASCRILKGAEMIYPYEGSKTLMIVVEDVENHQQMAELLDSMYEELPEPKKKNKSKIS